MVPTRDPHGSRTAALIGEYSLYLAALPLLSTAGGLTGSMFAVEGVAANGYLLYLAHRWGLLSSLSNHFSSRLSSVSSSLTLLSDSPSTTATAPTAPTAPTPPITRHPPPAGSKPTPPRPTHAR